MTLDARPGAPGGHGRPDVAPAPPRGAVRPEAAVRRTTPARGRRPGLMAVLAALVGVLGFLAALLLVAPPAQADDRLESSEPSDGQVLHEAPEQVVLTLSSDVVELSADVELVLPDGGHLDGLEVGVDGRVVVAVLPEDLAPGEYGVLWSVRCFDGHLVEGSFGFAVAPPAQRVPSGTTRVDDVATLTHPGADEGGAVVSTDVTAAWPVVVGGVAVLVVAGTAWLLVRRYR